MISRTGTDPGLISFTTAHLLQEIEDRRDEYNVEMGITFLKIYNEARDLQSPDWARISCAQGIASNKACTFYNYAQVATRHNFCLSQPIKHGISVVTTPSVDMPSLYCSCPLPLLSQCFGQRVQCNKINVAASWFIAQFWVALSYKVLIMWYPKCRWFGSAVVVVWLVWWSVKRWFESRSLICCGLLDYWFYYCCLCC